MIVFIKRSVARPRKLTTLQYVTACPCTVLPTTKQRASPTTCAVGQPSQIGSPAGFAGGARWCRQCATRDATGLPEGTRGVKVEACGAYRQVAARAGDPARGWQTSRSWRSAMACACPGTSGPTAGSRLRSASSRSPRCTRRTSSCGACRREHARACLPTEAPKHLCVYAARHTSAPVARSIARGRPARTSLLAGKDS